MSNTIQKKISKIRQQVKKKLKSRLELQQFNIEKVCSICYNQIIDQGYLNCKHTYCFKCIINWADQGQQTCPDCRTFFETVIRKRLKKNVLKRTIYYCSVDDRKTQIEKRIQLLQLRLMLLKLRKAIIECEYHIKQ